MPVIRRPQQQAIAARGQINPGAGIAAAASGGAIGQAVQQAGMQQAQQGLTMLSQAQEHLQKLNNAVNVAEYTNSLNNAKLTYAQSIDQRLQQTTDDKGNPTFHTLTQDVGDIGRKIKEETMARMQDPRAREKFARNFDSAIVNKQIQSLGQSRKQKLGYVKNSLSAGVVGLVQQAIDDDPANNKEYMGHVQDIVQSAFDAGALTSQDATKLINESRKDIFNGQLDRMMAHNPQQAVALLQSSDNEAFGLGEQEFEKAKTRAAKALDDWEDTKHIRELQDQQAKKEVANLQAGEIRKGILDGTAGQKDIATAEQEGLLDPEKVQELNQYYQKVTNEKIFHSETNLKISEAISNGRSAIDFSVGERDGHYKRRIQFAEDGQQPLTLAQKATMADDYKAPVKAYQHELEDILLRQDPQDPSEVLNAYQWSMDQAPEVLEGMNKQAKDVAALATNFMRHTSLSASDALNRARQTIVDPNTDVGRLNAQQYKKEKAFHEDLDSTVEDVFKKQSPDFFVGSKRFDTETKVIMQSLLQEAYIETGTVEGAVALVADRTKAKFGETQFNQETGIFGDTETVMFFPPEKLFPDIPFEDLKANLHTNVLEGADPASLPENLDELEIKSDSLTRMAGRPVSYAIVRRDEFGVPHPVLTRDGTVARWAPDKAEIEGRRVFEQGQLEAERRTQLENIAQRGRPEDEARIEAFRSAAEGTAGQEIRDTNREQREIMQEQKPLGHISAKYESGSRGPATISSGRGDPGGKSYGVHQLASKTGTLQAYIRNSEFKDEFEGLSPGSPAFDRKWRELAKNPEFARDQLEFIERTHMEPVRRIATNEGVPQTKAINEALFSSSVQHSRKGNARIIERAAATSPQSEQEWVNSLYDARADYVSRLRLPSATKKSVLNRYENERRDVLRLVQ